MTIVVFKNDCRFFTIYTLPSPPPNPPQLFLFYDIWRSFLNVTIYTIKDANEEVLFNIKPINKNWTDSIFSE